MPVDADADAGVPQDSLAVFMREIARHPLLTREQEVLLARRIERGDRDAMARMVNSNLRLVIANARGYEGLGVPLPDLIQEGSLGLIRAAEGFDHRKGFKFSTYATFWIRQAISRALDNGSRAIRIPATAGRRERRLDRAERELEARLGRKPTTDGTRVAARRRVRRPARVARAARAGRKPRARSAASRSLTDC
jgi:RNA polymerase primary sigma factor